MASKIKLKPCPFCGGEAKLLLVGKRPNGDEEWYVSCDSGNCSLYPHSTIPYVSAEIAAEVWNRRAENTRSAPAGNCAAMREALEMMSALFDKGVICTSYANTPEEMEQIEELYQKVKAALAAPPRNCDIYSHDEALRVWAAEKENEQNGCFDEWLYHAATEQKGETDESK